MTSIKHYFRKQCQLPKFNLEHDVVSDFYVSSFQKNRSAVPLLIIRGILFAGCLSIVITSMVLLARITAFSYWPIYLTHWGIALNTIAAGFGFAVSAVTVFRGPTDVSLGLPWYMKLYWMMYNIAIPIAFFITIFYWTLLSGIEIEFAPNVVLDVLIHAINSVLMLLLLVFDRVPSYLLHFYCPIGMGLVYLFFTIIYYFAGGTDPLGNVAIYPMVDWSNPGLTVGLVFVCAFGIFVVHAVVVAIALCRDVLSRKWRKENTAYDLEDGYY